MEIRVLGREREIDASLLDADPATVRAQVAAYDAGDRAAFDLDVTYPDGFTGRAVRETDAIPYGETRTYGDLAAAFDTAAVAVGGACGRNPLPVIVPCHRVVAADGLGGYGGGRALKRALLSHEGADVSGDG
jgi:methylated-DNA-[protein]-cysteine S-methyltransferase